MARNPHSLSTVRPLFRFTHRDFTPHIVLPESHLSHTTTNTTTTNTNTYHHPQPPQNLPSPHHNSTPSHHYSLHQLRLETTGAPHPLHSHVVLILGGQRVTQVLCQRHRVGATL